MKLTKFEIARILGARALQLSMGAPPVINIKGMNDSISIAEKEVESNKLPITIQRIMPERKEAA